MLHCNLPTAATKSSIPDRECQSFSGSLYTLKVRTLRKKSREIIHVCIRYCKQSPEVPKPRVTEVHEFGGDFPSKLCIQSTRIRVSQEHGKIQIEKNIDLKIGDLVSVIPVHSCLTIDKMREIFIESKKIKIMD